MNNQESAIETLKISLHSDLNMSEIKSVALHLYRIILVFSLLLFEVSFYPQVSLIEPPKKGNIGGRNRHFEPKHIFRLVFQIML